MNDVYAQYLGGAKPARSTVAVAELPRGALIEIDLVALMQRKGDRPVAPTVNFRRESKSIW